LKISLKWYLRSSVVYAGVTKHHTSPKYRSIRYKKGSNRRVQLTRVMQALTA